MTTYKGIHGRTLLHVASDLDSAEAEGQVWFNTTSSDYKTIVKVAGAWSSGGNMNQSGEGGAMAGIQTAAIYAGGNRPGSDTSALSEEYNGSTWAEGSNLNTGRRSVPGAGTQTAALCISGIDPAKANVEHYDGSSWSEEADVNSARGYAEATGTTSSAILWSSPATESWNGTAWSEVNDLNTGRNQSSGKQEQAQLL